MDDDHSTAEPRKPRSFTHSSRYVLSVDNQRKASFQDHAQAVAEGARIAAAFPRVNVTVHDQQEGAHETVSKPLPD
ncbi:MAG: hypothetical protein JWN93_3962 [Hyphomicrobiales bacterium]|nr:hypothetical protein [Hyphomicrobiales bacterium]